MFQLGSFPLLGSGSWRNYPLCYSKDCPTERTPVTIYCLQLKKKKGWFLCFIESETPRAWLYWNKRSSWCHIHCVKPKISALTLLTSFSLDPSQQHLPPYSAAQVKSIKRKLGEVIFYIKKEIKHQKTLKVAHWYSYLMYHLIQIISVYIYWNCLGWSMKTGLDKTQMKSFNWFMLCKVNTVPYKGFWHGLPFSNLCWLLSAIFVTFLWLEWFPGGFSP